MYSSALSSAALPASLPLAVSANMTFCLTVFHGSS